MPQAATTFLQPHNSFFKRSDGADRPYADQTAGFIAVSTAYLDGQPQYLGKEHSYQDAYVAIAV